jgi:hypothetical protein
MKKILLFILAIGVGGATIAQTINTKPVSFKAPTQELLMEAPASNAGVMGEGETPESYQKSINGVNATFIPIGNAGNAYSTAFNGRTYLWADPTINSVVFTHRMTGGTEVEGNSRVSYDVSTDGGATWQVNNQVYAPTGPDAGTGFPENAGRYPQGGIINPEGNTDPANTYYTYAATAMNGTNNNWGGYGLGSNMLTNLPPTATQANLTSEGDTWRLIPNSFHITQQGVAWYMDESSKYSAAADAYEYTGEIYIGKGVMVDGVVSYEEELVGFLDPLEAFNDMKIAFAPDGQTGYILGMAENIGDPVPFTNYHPILMKTTDGGENWGDPIDVQLGGEDGIESIKNYLPDSIITQMEGWEDWDGDRDILWFNMGFHADMVVDAMGNPYIVGMVTLATEDGWFPQIGSEFAIYSEDGGTTWDADELWSHIWWEGTVGDLPVYNRPQASIDYDGYNIFYSWLDSEVDQAEENDRPNIYCIGYDVEDHAYTEVVNVTYFTAAWNRAFYGSMSYYVFKISSEAFEIPFQYVEFTSPDVPTDPVNYWYINDFVMSPVDVPEIGQNAIDFTVGQNFPNPATNNTEILVNIKTDLPIELSVSNMLGQRVHSDVITSGAQAHAFHVNVSNFDPGMYLYTVKIGNQITTKKMLVE